MRRLLLFCHSLLFLGAALPVRADDPPVEKIVAGALAKSEADEKNLSRYEYLQHVTFEKLDKGGRATSTSRLDMRVLSGDQHDFQVIGTDGPVTEEQQDQAKLSQKFKLTFSLRKMEPRFAIRLDGKEEWNGKPVYRLAFSPKPDQPYNNRVEKLSNHFTGLMWIDAADFTLLRVKAKLDAPVSMAWILASMEDLDFSYDSAPLGGGAAPGRFLINYRIGFVVAKLRQRNEITTSDYVEKVPAIPASASAAP